MSDWYQIESDQLLTPALLFYPDRIKTNIDKMIDIAGTAERLRPHVKTYKCQEVVRMQNEAGIGKFKCATLVEAEMLAETGIPDILIAYPLVGPSLEAFDQLQERYPKSVFSVLVDHADQLEGWKKVSSDPIKVFIDINVGMNRTGIPAEGALQLIQQLDERFELVGLHVYDGHIHDSDLDERKQHVDQSYASVQTLLEKLDSPEPLEIICGGSLSFPIHAEHPERTLSPGTTMLWDHGYGSHFPDLDFDIAAVMATRVISKPGDDIICVDMGHKAVASEMSEMSVYFPELPNAKIEMLSEEHMALKTVSAYTFKIGDLIYGFPTHICPTVALHEQAQIIINKKPVDHWNITARKRTYKI